MKARLVSIYNRFGLLRLARYASETILACTALLAFRLLPLDQASALGGRLMQALGPRLKRSSGVVQPQLEQAFPDIVPEEKARLVKATWNNLGRIFAEYAHLDKMAERVTVVGVEHIAETLKSGEPVIFYTAHLANWEIVSIALRKHGVALHVVYRAPNNPWVDRIIQRLRRFGVEDRQIAKGASGAREIMAVLKKKGCVGLLVDQKMSGSPAIPFFGRPALTGPAIASFAMRYRARVIGLRVERLAGAYFRMTVLPPLPLPNSGDAEADIKNMLTTINGEIESWVRAHPAQWLWTHRRWGGINEE